MIAANRLEPLSAHGVLSYHLDSGCHEDLERVGTDHHDSMNEVLQGLKAAGLTEHAIHILRLIPIVRIVWADAPVHCLQYHSILLAAREYGIRPGMVAFRVLESWLRARPDEVIFKLWEDYIGALRWVMSDETYQSLCAASVNRAQATAMAMLPCLGTLRSENPHAAAVRKIANAFER